MSDPSKDKIYFVYEHWRPDTNECFYVGWGTASRSRHITRLHNKLHCAIVKKLKRLGLKVLIKVVASNIGPLRAVKLEMALIKFYGRRDMEEGPLANRTDGGDGIAGHRHSTESRKKISLGHDGTSRRGIGWRHSEDTKAKMSASSKGKQKSLEHKRSLSKANMGNKNHFGHKHSAEVREVMSLKARTRKRKPHSLKTRENMRIARLKVIERQRTEA